MSDIPLERVIKSMEMSPEEVEALPPAERRAHDDLQRLVVFGHDSRTDRDGNPIEQGIGSAAQPTRNSIEAYKRFHSPRAQDPDPAFEENLARMEAEYSAHVAARKAKAPVKRTGAVA